MARIVFLPLLPVPVPRGRDAEARVLRLSRGLRRVLACGLVLVLAWPAARGHSAWLGWLPLWLLGMPLSALWALHGCPVPRRPQRPPAGWLALAALPAARPWPRPAQARRRPPRGAAAGLARAA
ncbi:MAG: hypothetical protein ACLGHW_06840 [Gammaproteobacteria bacterium]